MIEIHHFLTLIKRVKNARSQRRNVWKKIETKNSENNLFSSIEKMNLESMPTISEVQLNKHCYYKELSTRSNNVIVSYLSIPTLKSLRFSGPLYVTASSESATSWTLFEPPNLKYNFINTVAYLEFTKTCLNIIETLHICLSNGNMKTSMLQKNWPC